MPASKNKNNKSHQFNKPAKKAKKSTRKRKLSVVGKGNKPAKKIVSSNVNVKNASKPKQKKKNKLKAFAVIVVCGESASKSMEVMSILASDSSEAMHLASLICVNRNTPNDVIIGALDLKDVKKIASFLEKSEFIGIN